MSCNTCQISIKSDTFLGILFTLHTKYNDHMFLDFTKGEWKAPRTTQQSSRNPAHGERTLCITFTWDMAHEENLSYHDSALPGGAPEI